MECYEPVKKGESAVSPILLYALMMEHFAIYVLVRVLNYGDDISVFWEKLIGVIFTVGVTSLIVWAARECFENKFISLKNLLVITVVVATIILIDFEYGGNISDFLNGNRIIWEFMVFGFAIFLSHLMRNLEDRKYVDVEKNITGVVLVILWTVIFFVLTKDLPLVYLTSLVLTNIILVGMAIFSFKTEEAKYGNRFVFWIGYALFCISYLFSKREPFESIMTFLYDEPTWMVYKENVKLLFENAKLFEVALGEGISKIGIELIQNNPNPVHSIVYYYGLIPMWIYIVVLVIVVKILSRSLKGIRRESSLYFIYVVAYINLVLRMVFGTLFSFAISPFQIELPFVGDVGSTIDWVCVGILMVGYYAYLERIGKVTLLGKIEDKCLDMLVSYVISGEEDENEKFEELEEECWRES